MKIDWSLWVQPSSPKSDSDRATDGRFRWNGGTDWLCLTLNCFRKSMAVEKEA